jgi:hypothetical protein
MNNHPPVCYTLDAALEQAISFENELFRSLLNSIRLVKQKGAGDILKEVASERLKYKQRLELALLEGDFGIDEVNNFAPTMNLDKRIGVEKLTRDADSRAALAYAIHLVSASVKFYDEMVKACAGAPMHIVFISLDADQTKQLQRLEDQYEEHFMTEN